MTGVGNCSSAHVYDAAWRVCIVVFRFKHGLVDVHLRLVLHAGMQMAARLRGHEVRGEEEGGAGARGDASEHSVTQQQPGLAVPSAREDVLHVLQQPPHAAQAVEARHPRVRKHHRVHQTRLRHARRQGGVAREACKEGAVVPTNPQAKAELLERDRVSTGEESRRLVKRSRSSRMHITWELEICKALGHGVTLHTATNRILHRGTVHVHECLHCAAFSMAFLNIQGPKRCLVF
mmetsp:Transcript_10016/g.18944  ORF Transcript_10016/g.18944 Transcript_10016/m.18944 type:complete len:234 (+) Transcript_10016:681-1382(+)